MIFRTSGREVDWAVEIGEQSWGYRAARLLHVASGVGIFRRLGKGAADAKTLAADLGLVADMAEKMCIGLAAMGLLTLEGKAWNLTPKARATLLPDSPHYQGDMLAHGAGVWTFWSDLESVARGRKAAWVLDETKGQTITRDWRAFILAMHNMAMAGRAAALADAVDLHACRTLVDVGGGPGSYAMALCERNPELHATVLDLPQTVEIAREVIHRLGMADRAGAKVGDWNTDEFGRNVDAVLMSNVLHGATSDAEMKLAKAHRALVPGGRLILQDFLLDDTRTGPIIPALFNIMVGAFTRSELLERVQAAGFRDIRFAPMPASAGTMLLLAVK
jgi:SAM-dependent methyltransferase